MGVGLLFSLFGMAALLLVRETSMRQDPLRAPEKIHGDRGDRKASVLTCKSSSACSFYWSCLVHVNWQYEGLSYGKGG